MIESLRWEARTRYIWHDIRHVLFEWVTLLVVGALGFLEPTGPDHELPVQRLKCLWLGSVSVCVVVGVVVCVCFLCVCLCVCGRSEEQDV